LWNLIPEHIEPKCLIDIVQKYKVEFGPIWSFYSTATCYETPIIKLNDTLSNDGGVSVMIVAWIKLIPSGC
jgi:hypothetical protein